MNQQNVYTPIDSEAINDELIISCEQCMAEVPSSAATNDEAAGYFSHFCGLECYQDWQKQEQHTTAR